MPKLMDSSDSEEDDEPAPARLPFIIQSTVHTINEGIMASSLGKYQDGTGRVISTTCAFTEPQALPPTSALGFPSADGTGRLQQLSSKPATRLTLSQSTFLKKVRGYNYHYPSAEGFTRDGLWSMDMPEAPFLHSRQPLPCSECKPGV
jgi:hypothetical protein